MKKFLLIVFILLALTVGMFFVFIGRFLDNESYKKQIIETVQELTGRKVSVTGNVDVTLFPSPIIVLNGIEIKNEIELENPNTLTIKQINASVKWKSLFKTPLVIESLTFTEPVFNFERNEDGQPNWVFAFMHPKSVYLSDANIGKSVLEVPPQFKNLLIQNGKLSYKDPTRDISYQVSDINGTITANSLSGPFLFSGNLLMNETVWHTEFQTGKLAAADSSTDIKLNLTEPTSKSVFLLKGKATNILNDLTFNGNFSFNIPRVSTFLRALKVEKSGVENINSSLLGNTEINFSTNAISVKDGTLRYGGISLENTISTTFTLNYPSKENKHWTNDISLLISKLNLDLFKDIFINPKNELEDFLKSITSENSLKIKADSIILKGKEIKTPTFELKLTKDLLNIEKAQMILPGMTQFSATGSIETKETGLTSRLKLDVKSPTPEVLWKWAELPEETTFLYTKLKNLAFKSALTITPESYTFKLLNIHLDGSEITGEALFFKNKEKPTGALILNGKNIDFDTYLKFEKSQETRTIQKTLQDTFSELTRFISLGDFVFKINLKDVTFKGIPITELMHDGKIQGNLWSIEKLDIQGAAQASLNTNGNIRHLSDKNEIELENLTYTATIQNPFVFMQKAMIKSPVSGNLSNIKTSGTISGTLEKLELDTTFNFSQANIKTKGTLNFKQDASADYNMNVEITHPNFRQFIKLFKPNFNEFPYLVGTLQFKGNAEKVDNLISISDTAATIGTQEFGGNLSINNWSNFKGNITAPTFKLEKILSLKNFYKDADPLSGKITFSKEEFNFDKLAGKEFDLNFAIDRLMISNVSLNDVKTQIQLTPKLITLVSFDSGLNGGKLSMKGTINSTNFEPALNVTVQGENISLPPEILNAGPFKIKNGETTFALELNARGKTPSDMTTTLYSDGSFSVQKGTLTDLNISGMLEKVISIGTKTQEKEAFERILLTTLMAGETAFDLISGSFSVREGKFRMENMQTEMKDATIKTQISFDIATWDIISSSEVSLLDLKNTPPFRTIVKGAGPAAEVQIVLTPILSDLIMYSKEVNALKKQKTIAQEKAQKKATEKERKDRALQLVKETKKILEEAEKSYHLAKTREALAELEKAKDSFSIILDLSKQSTLSQKDIQIIEEQAHNALQKARKSQTLSIDNAARILREMHAQIYTKTQQKMEKIINIHTRLKGVDFIEVAYTKAHRAMEFMDEITGTINTSRDIPKIAQLSEQGKEAMDVITKVYDELEQYDVAQPSEKNNQKKSSFKGKIKRKSSF